MLLPVLVISTMQQVGMSSKTEREREVDLGACLSSQWFLFDVAILQEATSNEPTTYMYDDC